MKGSIKNLAKTVILTVIDFIECLHFGLDIKYADDVKHRLRPSS